MKIHFWHRVGKYDLNSELPRDFCAEIGPLQLDVVLVFFSIFTFIIFFFLRHFHIACFFKRCMCICQVII